MLKGYSVPQGIFCTFPKGSSGNPVQDLDLELDLDELINLELDLVSNLILY